MANTEQADVLGLQAHLSSGYLSLASALRDAGYQKTFIAPVGLSYQHIYTMNGAQATTLSDAWEEWDSTNHTWHKTEAFLNQTFNRNDERASLGLGSPAPQDHAKSPEGQSNIADVAPSHVTVAPVAGPQASNEDGYAVAAFGSPTAATAMAGGGIDMGSVQENPGTRSDETTFSGQNQLDIVQQALSQVQVGMSFSEIPGLASWVEDRAHEGSGTMQTTTAKTALRPAMQSHPVASSSAVPAMAAPSIRYRDAWPKSNVTLDKIGDYQDGKAVAEGEKEKPTGQLGSVNTFNWLYKSDGQHPSSLGSYLAACTIASAISGTGTPLMHLPSFFKSSKITVLRRNVLEHVGCSQS
jgi:hypothetical protein